VDYGGDQIPITGAVPRLSWTLPTSIGTVTGTRLEAGIDGRAPIIHELGPEHRFVPWPAVPLASGTRVAWRVRARGCAGEELSDWSTFEVGLRGGGWKARRIRPAGGCEPGYGM